MLSGDALLPSDRLVVVMVGLPARGKTFTARKIARFLRWRGWSAQVFNVGNYRRERFGAQVPHWFFDPDNPAGLAARRAAAMTALDDLLAWCRLGDGGRVALYDGTNSTRARRRLVYERCAQANLPVVFVESICTDSDIIESNIRQTKLAAPDYLGVDAEQAVADFRHRIDHYKQAYETITDDQLSFVKLIDAGRQVVLNRIQGYLQARLVAFTMNLHITPRPILLTRHGQSEHNAAGIIGGDSPLTERGRAYARGLANHIKSAQLPGLAVWTSTLSRALETAQPLDLPSMQLRSLDEIDAGICDGHTYAEIAQRHPEEFQARQQDKLRYRYPRGESYEDVIQRLEPVICEIERRRAPLLVVAHQAVLRALYAYLVGHPREDCPYLSIPLHTLICLTPHAYGCDEQRIELDVPPEASSSS